MEFEEFAGDEPVTEFSVNVGQQFNNDTPTTMMSWTNATNNTTTTTITTNLNQMNIESNNGFNVPSLGSIKLWNQNIKICDFISQSIQDFTRDLDPFAALLIIAALIIAIVGCIAIVCQCHLWRKSKRQRHYDTNSWLEYTLDREKLTCVNDEYKTMNQRELKNKKLISKWFQSSLLPPVKLSPHTVLATTGCTKVMPTNLATPASFTGSELYLNSTPSKQCTVDIDQCQLIQSFMKHQTPTNGGQRNGKKIKKKTSDKTNKQNNTGKNNNGISRIEKKLAANSKLSKPKPKYCNSKKQNKKSSNGLLLEHKTNIDTLPFFATNGSSKSSSSGLIEHHHQQEHINLGPPLALYKEYETQTVELNLTGSDDGDSHCNVDIDNTYAKISRQSHTDSEPVSDGGTVAADICQINEPIVGKELIRSKIGAKPTSVTNGNKHAQNSSNISSKSTHHLSKMSLTAATNNVPSRLRQQVPVNQPVVNEVNGESNRKTKSASILPFSSSTTNKYTSGGGGGGGGAGVANHTATKSATSVGTLSKNPLYNEIGEHEESMYKTNQLNKVGGGFALEKDNQQYSHSIQPPLQGRHLTYTTFIKPPETQLNP